MSDRMKHKKKKHREPSPVENTLDLRGRERSRNEEPFPNPPKAPDGVSGDWR